MRLNQPSGRLAARDGSPAGACAAGAAALSKRPQGDFLLAADAAPGGPERGWVVKLSKWLRKPLCTCTSEPGQAKCEAGWGSLSRTRKKGGAQPQEQAGPDAAFQQRCCSAPCTRLDSRDDPAQIARPEVVCSGLLKQNKPHAATPWASMAEAARNHAKQAHCAIGWEQPPTSAALCRASRPFQLCLRPT